MIDRGEKAAILAEILALSRPPRKQPNDVTIQDFVAEDECSETTANRCLTKLVEVGTLTTMMVYDAERHCRVRVWRKVEGAT